jgi:hypothetical protein
MLDLGGADRALERIDDRQRLDPLSTLQVFAVHPLAAYRNGTATLTLSIAKTDTLSDRHRTLASPIKRLLRFGARGHCRPFAVHGWIAGTGRFALNANVQA